MQTGQVVWFNDSKGFGLIETQSGQTVFVHYTSIQFSSSFQQNEFRKLTPGQLVEFDLYEDDAKGYFARNVITVGNA